MTAIDGIGIVLLCGLASMVLTLLLIFGWNVFIERKEE